MERREHSRIEFSAHCQVISGSSNSFSSEGVTENISRNGLLFKVAGVPADNLPNLSDVVAVDILLPENRRFGRRCLRCRGNVVRILPTPAGARIAIAISHMEFRDFADHARRRQTGEKAWSALLYRA